MKKILTPLVTIVTPTYNRADLLGETIESVLSQDYPNLEYIVIDDGSKDNTEKVVNRYKNKFPNRKFLYIKQKNAGETSAVNKGFSLSNGEIICVVNSDDSLLPSSVTTMVNFLYDNPNILVVYPNIEVIDVQSKHRFIGYVVDYNYIYMIKNQSCIIGQGAFFKSKALEYTKGRDASFKYVADFDFWLRLGMYGEFKKIEKVLAKSRSHVGSQTEYGKGDEMALEHIHLVKKTFSDPNLPKQYLKYKSYAYSQAYIHAGGLFKSKNKALASYFRSFLYHPWNFISRIRNLLTMYKKRQDNRKKRSIFGSILYYLGEIF